MRPEVDKSVWAGRVDMEEGGDALRWHQVIKPLEAGCEPGVALLGFACDEGVRRNLGRAGARKGPRALRKALVGFAAHSTRPLYDASDVECQDGDLERAHLEYGSRINTLLQAGHFPVGLGGGHEIAYGTFLGLAQFVDTSNVARRIGIVNLDAHFDLRHASAPNSGTSFLRVAEYCQSHGFPFHYCCLGIAEPSNTTALFDCARKLRVTWRCDDRLNISALPETLATLGEFVTGVDHLYLTICLDVLPASIAPGVSAPAAHGVSIEVIEAIVEEVKRTGKLRAADVAELNPDFDQDDRTARIAARLVYQITR